MNKRTIFSRYTGVNEAALKLLRLALQNITQKWTMPIKEWKAALKRFAILFADGMPVLY